MHTRMSSVLWGVVLSASVAFGTSALAAQTASAQKPADQKADTKKEGNAITDGWITMKVHAQYITEDALDGSDIDVDTNAGVVTLTGTVRTAAGHARAVAIAKATDGVKNVSDKLRVVADTDKPAATTGKTGRTMNDGWIKSKIYSQFLGEDALEHSDIDVHVKNGVVTLTGTVAAAAGRTRALAIAKSTDGVKDVKDTLKVSK